MTNVSTPAGSAEVTAIDTQARGPLLYLLVSGVAWLVVSGFLALIASIQLHSPHFLADCAWFTIGRTQAMRDTAFIYGWGGNAALGISLWLLGRLGAFPLRGLNWTVVGTVFWNLGIFAGLVGIAAGDMTGFSFLQLPRYVLPLLVVAYAAVGMTGVLAWSGRRYDGMYASQWYALAGLFLFPWMLCGAQAVLLWWPVRGAVQAVAATWYGQAVWTLWLAPVALAAAYYIVPKVVGKALPSYESAPLGFWTLIFVGSWMGGRHLIGGPVPAWVPTMAVVAGSLLLFHYLVLGLNFRVAFQSGGTALRFVRFGLVAYVLAGLLEFLTSFRGIAASTQFTFVNNAIEQLGLYGGVSMLFFGAIYFLVPRLTVQPWASAGLLGGHRILVTAGVLLSVVALAYAGLSQGAGLLDDKVTFATIFGQIRMVLLVNTAAQLLLVTGNVLLLVNLVRTACPGTAPVPARSLFRQPAKLEAHAS